jgi:hypothetical protein
VHHRVFLFDQENHVQSSFLGLYNKEKSVIGH